MSEEIRIANLNPGDNIDEISLIAKTVLQGKISKAGNPYQHIWLTDGKDDIRFSLFNGDVNKVAEGQKITVWNAYVKEYPEGSGKLQLALSKDNGRWQQAESQPAPQSKPEPQYIPAQHFHDGPPSAAAQAILHENDEKQKMIVRQTCLKVVAELLKGQQGLDQKTFTDAVIAHARPLYRWAMGWGPHWMENEDARKRFWATLGEHGLDSAYAHRELHVYSMYDFEGMEEQALDIILGLDKTPQEKPPERKSAGIAENFPVGKIEHWGALFGAVWANLGKNRSEVLEACGVEKQEDIAGNTWTERYQTIVRAFSPTGNTAAEDTADLFGE